jgi:hypothetical protein
MSGKHGWASVTAHESAFPTRTAKLSYFLTALMYEAIKRNFRNCLYENTYGPTSIVLCIWIQTCTRHRTVNHSYVPTAQPAYFINVVTRIGFFVKPSYVYSTKSSPMLASIFFTIASWWLNNKAETSYCVYIIRNLISNITKGCVWLCSFYAFSAVQ